MTRELLEDLAIWCNAQPGPVTFTLEQFAGGWKVFVHHHGSGTAIWKATTKGLHELEIDVARWLAHVRNS